MLIRTAEAVVWWTPAAYRTMFFRSTAEDTQGLNGKRFPHPPLVWCVSGRELWVRAMLENARPKPTTKLRVAPYFNVNGEDGLTAKERCDRRKMPESRQFHIGSRRSFRVNSRIRRAVGGSPPILADSWDCGRVYREAENRFPSSTWLRRTRRSWSSQRVIHD